MKEIGLTSLDHPPKTNRAEDRYKTVTGMDFISQLAAEGGAPAKIGLHPSVFCVASGRNVYPRQELTQLINYKDIHE